MTDDDWVWVLQGCILCAVMLLFIVVGTLVFG